jgi:hypothetical protein
MVGTDESTSTVGAAEAVVVVVVLEVAAAGALAEVRPGVGLPRRLPDPAKGTYFFLGCL